MRIAGRADKLRIEGVDVGREHRRGIAPRIDAHEQHAQIRQRRALFDPRKHCERCRTNIRAMGKTKEHQSRVSLKITRRE